MSEKRFELEYEESDYIVINDIEGGGLTIYNGKFKELWLQEIVDELNSLSEANERLEERRGELETKNILLKNENKQLRLELETHKHPLWSTREAEKEVYKLVDSLADEVRKNGLLNEEINRLRIENMRLKKAETMI